MIADDELEAADVRRVIEQRVRVRLPRVDLERLHRAEVGAEPVRKADVPHRRVRACRYVDERKQRPEESNDVEAEQFPALDKASEDGKANPAGAGLVRSDQHSTTPQLPLHRSFVVHARGKLGWLDDS